MQIDASRYRVKLAETEAERAGAQRLRYRVFVEEMGARASPEEQAARREWDDFDPFFDHLVLLSLDPAIADPLDRVVGVYRLMRGEVAGGRPRLLRRGRVRPGADRRLGPGLGRARALLRGARASRRAGDAPAVERARRLRAGAQHRAAVRGRELPRHRPGAAGRGAVVPALRAPGAARPAGAGAARALPRDEPDAARGDRLRRGRCSRSRR